MNILYIMSDSLVPQLAGPYGDTVGGTPNLDALAASGTVFETAYCNSPMCAPSRASMVTGRYVSDIGAWDNAAEFLSEWPTIGHALEAAGYETSIVGKMHFVGHDQHHGFGKRIALDTDYTKEYDPFDYRLAWRWDLPSRGNPWGVDWMGPSYVDPEKWSDYPVHFDWDERIHNAALNFLGRKSRNSDPFFCCVSYHAPHNPFWIHDKVRDLFRDKELPLPSVPDGVNPIHGPMDEWLNAFHYVPDIRDRLMDYDNLRWLYETYYGVVYDMDKRIGELLDMLDRRGLREDTAILFASDHGDMLARRGMVQKRCFYEPASRIALIGSFPGQWPEGARIETPVSLIDLFPTLTELTEAPNPEDLEGVSLLPSLTEGEEPPNRIIFGEYHGEGTHAPGFMAVKDHYKYIYVHEYEERFYDLKADPDEWVNRIGDHEYRPMISELRSAVLRQFEPDDIAKRALQSQRNRNFVYDCANLAKEVRNGVRA